MAPPPAAGQTAVNARRFVLGALTATLAVAAVVTVSFVVLSPARVHLSVTDARIIPGESHDGAVELLLTLAANNTSKRAAVRYESMFVDLTNSTGPEVDFFFVRANLTTHMPLTLSRRRGRAASFSATLLLVPGIWTDSSGNMTCKNSFAVIVAAMARFEVGIAHTRLFDIKLACRPVSFIRVDAAGKLSGAPGGLPPVGCEPS